MTVGHVMRRQRRQWTEEEKRAVAAYAVEHGNASAVRRFDCSRQSVVNWKKQYGPGDRPSLDRNPDGTFPKGVSGNPDGISSAQRNARELAAQAAERILSVYIEEFDIIAEQDAGLRDLEALFEVGDRILDRGIGKPKQTTALEGGDKPVEIKPRINPRDLPPEVLRALLAARSKVDG